MMKILPEERVLEEAIIGTQVSVVTIKKMRFFCYVQDGNY